MSKPIDPRAVPTVQVDNDSVRVTEWRFAPGATTGWHRHGQAYYRPAGAEHDVRNANAFEFVFVEIELKTPTPAPGGAR